MHSSLSNPAKSEEEEEEEEGKEETRLVDGVKEDISDLTKTISRQLHTVASFIAPTSPPAALGPRPKDKESLVSSSAMLSGIRKDFVEIGSIFRAGLSHLASSFMRFRPEDEAGDCSGVGITSDVLEFARNVSTRADCWLDFPFPSDDNDVRDPKEAFCSSLSYISNPIMQIIEATHLLHQQQLETITHAQFQCSMADCSSLDENIISSIQENYISILEEVLVHKVNAGELDKVNNKWAEENGKFGTSIDAEKQPRSMESISFSNLVENISLSNLVEDISLSDLVDNDDASIIHASLNMSPKADYSCINPSIINHNSWENYNSFLVNEVLVDTANANELDNVRDESLEENGKGGTFMHATKQYGTEDYVSFSDLLDLVDVDDGFIRLACQRSVQDALMSSSNSISDEYVELSKDPNNVPGGGNNTVQPISLVGSDFSDWQMIGDLDSHISGTA